MMQLRNFVIVIAVIVPGSDATGLARKVSEEITDAT